MCVVGGVCVGGGGGGESECVCMCVDMCARLCISARVYVPSHTLLQIALLLFVEENSLAGLWLRRNN